MTMTWATAEYNSIRNVNCSRTYYLSPTNKCNVPKKARANPANHLSNTTRCPQNQLSSLCLRLRPRLRLRLRLNLRVRNHGHNNEEDSAQHVSREVVAPEHPVAPVPRLQHERRPEVHHGELRHEDSREPPGGVPTGADDRLGAGAELPASEPLAGREQGEGQEEHVVTRVETVPERAHAVRDEEAPPRPGVYVPPQPVRRLLVPGGRTDPTVWGELAGHYVHTVALLPPEGFTRLGVVALETSVPEIRSALCGLPRQVVFVPVCEEGDDLKSKKKGGGGGLWLDD